MTREDKTPKNDNRRELKLAGPVESKKITENGFCLEEAIYSMSALNLLDVNDTTLERISPSIGNLVHLQSLLLYRNQIAEVPATIGQLAELKVLDLSGNKLCELPSEFSKLQSLTTLNLSFNRLKTINLSTLEKLNVCNLSGNELKEVPSFHVGHVHYLTEVNLEKNCITEIPEELTQQQILRVLNLAENKIVLVPKYLTKCVKLKEINLKGNPLKDKRLLKLVDQCRSKQVLDYVEKNGHQPTKGSSAGKSNDAHPEVDEQTSSPEPIEKEDEVQLKIIVHKATTNAPKVSFTSEARDTRPHLVLCIVRGFPVKDMRKFLQLQNALHDTECMRREVATIATHDLAKIKGAVRYHAAPPGEIHITALGQASQGKVTAEKYYANLCHQADLLRKEKKRNNYSGVYKYITLLSARELFAFLSDDEKVISLPPLTNCDETRISSTTTDMLIEVTSSVGHSHCVRVMNALLEAMLLMDVEEITSNVSSSNGTDSSNAVEKKKKSKSSKTATQSTKVRYDRSVTLTVEQVQLYDGEGKPHSVFPGRGDLQGNETKRITVEMSVG